MSKQTKTVIEDGLLNDMLDKVTAELVKAIRKFPEFPNDVVHQSAIVAEESGELVQACLDKFYGRDEGFSNIRKEATQTAAMCVRMLMHSYYGEGNR